MAVLPKVRLEQDGGIRELIQELDAEPKPRWRELQSVLTPRSYAKTYLPPDKAPEPGEPFSVTTDGLLSRESLLQSLGVPAVRLRPVAGGTTQPAGTSALLQPVPNMVALGTPSLGNAFLPRRELLSLPLRRYEMTLFSEEGKPVVEIRLRSYEGEVTNLIEGEEAIRDFMLKARYLIEQYESTGARTALGHAGAEMDVEIKGRKIFFKGEELLQFVDDHRRVLLALESWDTLHA